MGSDRNIFQAVGGPPSGRGGGCVQREDGCQQGRIPAGAGRRCRRELGRPVEKMGPRLCGAAERFRQRVPDDVGRSPPVRSRLFY